MKNISRIFDILYYQLENCPLEKALSTKRDGRWHTISTQEYVNLSNQLSRGLLKLGVQPNDKIAVATSSNIGEWNILDIALLQIGAQNVPIYPTSSIESYHYILNHSQSTYVFISDEEVLEKAQEAQKGTQVKGIYSFNNLKGCESWETILAMGEDKSLQEKVDQIKDRIQPDDLATLIYTSGTTGKPKGVMLTHKNITSNVLDSAPKVPFERGTETALSFLPVCHVFERMLIYLYQYYAVSVYYAESIDTIADNIKEVKPTFMTAVPRLLEKVYEAFYFKGNSSKGLKRQIFHWAVKIGKAYQPFQKQSWFYKLQLNLAKKLVLSKWKEGVGGRLDLIVSGSAALRPELSHIYAAADMLILEGYGLTETSPVIAVNGNSKDEFKIGTVGTTIDHVKVKIANDGEILVKGPNVMKGYYKDEEKTKASFDADGYFYTGDIGELDENGFLKITDRKKQLFKTSGGKYISPQQLESALQVSPFIEQIVVIGEGRKMPAALIQPSFEHVKKWCEHKGIQLKNDTFKGIVQNQVIIDRIQEEIDLYNKKFGHWEQVKDFRLTPEEWSIDGGQLTPTLKVKRKEVIKMYQDLCDSIYGKI